MTQVATYDVFDTVITRTIGSPRQVFVETGRLLRRIGVLNVTAEQYASAREEAGRDLTEDIAHHPTLAAIASEVAARLGLHPRVAEQLSGAELEVEAAVCRALPGVAGRIAARRHETGRGVVFISDTSMPSDALEALLRREALFLDGDRLYTSAAMGASKQDGGLYDVVTTDLQAASPTFDHVGDNEWSDLAHARLRGWHATLETRARLNRYECLLDDAGLATAGLGPRLAGASRLGRVAAVERGIDPALAGIAGGVALPLLTGFGLWVLQQAQLLGLDRLYFVARDGEIFLEVTTRLAEQTGENPECGYLYGSRRSWQLAALGADGGPIDPWIPDDRQPESMTAREILALVGLTPPAALAQTNLGFLQDDAADQPLGLQDWAVLRAALQVGPLADAAADQAAQRRALLLRYLDEQGVTAPGRVGLVDVGWTGRAARSLEDVLRSASRPLPAAHLFVGLLATAPARMGADLYSRSQGWLLDEARGRRNRSGEEDPVMIIESFAMGSEGHTLGYRESTEGVRPELADAVNPGVRAWHFDDYRQALALSLDTLLDGPPLTPDVDLRPVAWRQLLMFWNSPTTGEAAAWGAQPYAEDFANARSHPLATAVTGRRMLTRLGIGSPEWREPTYWLAGTIAISPQPWRALLQRLRRAQEAARRLTRIPARARGEWAIRRTD